MNILVRLLPLLVLSLAACAPKPAASAKQLMLSAAEFPRIASIEPQMEIGDEPGSDANADSLRPYGVHSAARYRYHLRGPDGGVYKVHILLFADEAAAVKDWQTRHRPEALAQTQPLSLDGPGDAWIYPNPEKGELAEVRVGRAVVEIKARGAATQLAAFSRAMAAHAAKRLKR